MQTFQIGSVAFNAQKTVHAKSFTASPVFPRLCEQSVVKVDRGTILLLYFAFALVHEVPKL